MNAINHAALAIPAAAANSNAFNPPPGFVAACRGHAQRCMALARQFQEQAEARGVGLFERKRLTLRAEANALLGDSWTHDAEGDKSGAERMRREANRLLAQARAVHHA